MIKANELEVGKVYEGVKKQTKEIRRFRVICKDRNDCEFQFWKPVVAIDEETKNIVYFDKNSTNSDSDRYFLYKEDRNLLQGFELILENQQYKVLTCRLFENSKYGLTQEDLEGRGDIFDVSVSKDKFGEWNTKVEVVKMRER